MGNTAKKIQEAGMILGGLGVIGFIGVVWLMIYGNLSGNLGFTDESITTINETEAWANTTGYTLAASGNVGANSFVATIVYSSMCDSCDGSGTDGVYNYSIDVANLSISSIGVVTNASTFNTTLLSNISITYTQLQDTQNEINSDQVINNVTAGFGTFFEFSGTFFTIAAIVLLIFMLLGLLALVMSIVKTQGGSSRGFSS